MNISESDCERNGIKSASGAGDNFRRGVLTGVQLEEVALVDVAGHWQVLISIMRPLVSPGILTAALIGSWSEFLIAKTFLQNAVKVTAMVFSSSSLASTARPGGDHGGRSHCRSAYCGALRAVAAAFHRKASPAAPLKADQEQDFQRVNK